MILRGSWLGVPVVAVLGAVALFGVGGAAATTRTRQAGSPCRTMGSVATWSPSGKRIAFVGYGVRSTAFCVADADGRHARPLRRATCTRRGYCPFINTPAELYWQRPKRLIYGDAAKGIFAVPLAGKPKRFGASTDTYGAFSVDAAGDRLAYGSPAGPDSRGPVTVLSVPSGRVVGKIGGPTTAYTSPSLSPNGKQVAFVGATQVLTASATGRRVQPLEQCAGGDPVWSPSAKWIACLGPPKAWPSGPALVLVSPQTHASITVVRASLGVRNIFGWSPNSLRIAFSADNSAGGSRLDVVNLATDKVRQFLSPSGDYVAWSGDSRRLLAIHDCRLWRVPVYGSEKPRRLRASSPPESQVPC